MSIVKMIRSGLGLNGSSVAEEPKTVDDRDGATTPIASTSSEKSVSKRREHVVRWAPPVVATGILLTTMMITSGVDSDRSHTLNSEKSQITSLKNQIDVTRIAAQDKANQINSQVSGISSERQTGDDAAIRGLMSKVTTWSSYDEYEANREAIMRQYKIDEKSSFMTSFMPKINSIKDNNGTSYNKIDTNGLNMKMTNFTSSVIKVAGNAYTYIGVATIQTTNATTSGSATTYTFVEYTTDPAHDLTDLKGYPMGSHPSTVGTLTDIYN